LTLFFHALITFGLSAKYDRSGLLRRGGSRRRLGLSTYR